MPCSALDRPGERCGCPLSRGLVRRARFCPNRVLVRATSAPEWARSRNQSVAESCCHERQLSAPREVLARSRVAFEAALCGAGPVRRPGSSSPSRRNTLRTGPVGSAEWLWSPRSTGRPRRPVSGDKSAGWLLPVPAEVRRGQEEGDVVVVGMDIDPLKDLADRLEPAPWHVVAHASSSSQDGRPERNHRHATEADVRSWRRYAWLCRSAGSPATTRT
jgi:hypothetical protein